MTRTLYHDPHRTTLRQSACPYARYARLAVAGSCDVRRQRGTQISTLGSQFHTFVQTGEQRNLDAFVIPINGADKASVEQLARMLRIVLEQCSSTTTEVPEDHLAGIDDADWDFEHLGTRFFIVTLSPSYPRTHTRHVNTDSLGYILIQPEHSFRRFGISGTHPYRKQISRAVQRAFERRGQHYDLAMTTVLPKKYRYVIRVSPDDEPVRWWLPD